MVFARKLRAIYDYAFTPRAKCLVVSFIRRYMEKYRRHAFSRRVVAYGIRAFHFRSLSVFRFAPTSEIYPPARY